jgi:hypothetical protein
VVIELGSRSAAREGDAEVNRMAAVKQAKR